MYAQAQERNSVYLPGWSMRSAQQSKSFPHTIQT
jgi:hypothetical protein